MPLTSEDLAEELLRAELRGALAERERQVRARRVFLLSGQVIKDHVQAQQRGLRAGVPVDPESVDVVLSLLEGLCEVVEGGWVLEPNAASIAKATAVRAAAEEEG